MTDTSALKARIDEKGLKLGFVAKQINVSREGFRLKMNKETEFKASEILTLKNLLDLDSDDLNNIFFTNDVN